jgi:hypothetical protein
MPIRPCAVDYPSTYSRAVLRFEAFSNHRLHGDSLLRAMRGSVSCARPLRYMQDGDCGRCYIMVGARNCTRDSKVYINSSTAATPPYALPRLRSSHLPLSVSASLSLSFTFPRLLRHGVPHLRLGPRRCRRLLHRHQDHVLDFGVPLQEGTWL